MPEEGLETQDVKDQVEEAQEHAREAEEEAREDRRDTRWLTWLSLSTACLAGLAAVASLHAGALANEALLKKSDAVLAESEYADNWAEYQSRNMKAYLFDTQAALLAEAARKSAEGHAQHERDEAEKLKPIANRLRKKVNDSNEASTQRIERHELFAKTVTIFQISIAVAAMGALTRKKPMWWLSMIGGAIGVALLLVGFVSNARETPREAADTEQAR
jgi:hypothetical protein